MMLYLPQYASPTREGLIPPSPLAERRESRRRLIAKEMRYPLSGRVLLPGIPFYEETLRCMTGRTGSMSGGMQVLSGLETQLLGSHAASAGPSVSPDVFWRLEDVNDSVGSLNFTNTGVTFGAGKIGNCAQFDTTNNLQVASASALQGGDIPLCIWGWTLITTTSGTKTPFSKWTSTANREYETTIQAGPSNKMAWGVTPDHTNETAVTANTFGALSISTWYFFAVRHDPVGNVIEISINGGAWDQVSYSSGIYIGTSNFCIGCKLSGTTPFDKMAGSVDAVAVFHNQTVSNADVILGYNGGAGTEYYAGAWH